MKFEINDTSKENIYNLMRKVGYIFKQKDERSNELNFIRPLERNGYPRFHLYLKTGGDNLIFNLHLDQKKSIHKGVPAHSGEYEGKVVERETERIRKILEAEKT